MADFLDYMIEDAHTAAVMLLLRKRFATVPPSSTLLAKARRLGKP